MSKLDHRAVFFVGVMTASALVSGCEREEKPRATQAAALPASNEAQRVVEGPPAATAKPPSMTIPGVVSCEPAAEVTGLLSRISETADANRNGEIEKTEAYSAADFLVGGFFFRADKNFDGSLSPEEGRATRTELMNRSPTLAAVMRRAATSENSAALARMADLVGIEYDKAVSSTEMREAAHQLVDELYRLADADKNGSLTQGEAFQAGWSRMRALGSSAFLAYDSDGDKNLTLDEFQAALKEPSRLAFEAADLNKDGRLTDADVSSAVRGLAQRAWLPSVQPSKAADAKPTQN